MNRLLLHILFWLAYLLFLVVTELAWVKASHPALNNKDLLINATLACIVTIVPQILFAYYLSYYALNRFIKKRGNVVVNILLILTLFFTCITVIAYLAHVIIAPFIYHIPYTPDGMFRINQILSFLIYTGFSAGIMGSIKFVRTQLRSAEREKNLIHEKLTTELKLLRNQLNPHFLFNTLNNIYALTRKKSDQAPEVVMKLSELLSFMLYESDRDTIPVSKEIALLEDYIGLEKLRYTDRLSVVFKKDIDNFNQPVSPLLLLPLVENAFKHGVSETRFNSYINMNLSIKESNFEFFIENNFETEPLKENHNSIGLNNIKRQLELIYKEHSLEVSKSHNIYKVELKINLNTYGKI